jgi:hypothetical protein
MYTRGGRMNLPRFHLFEFEDQPWYPCIVRDLSTDYLCFIQSALGLHRPIVPVLADALRAAGARDILDLCSGGGGPVISLQASLAAAGLSTHVTLTDRFPNRRAFQRIAGASDGKIGFVAKSVDARFVPPRLGCFRTIFNSFHHFREADAKKILRDAAKGGHAIAIFEYPERSAMLILLTLCLTPFLVALATPFIRPFRWRRLFFTYLAPLVPLTCWWDGVVSHLRAYTVDELRSLADEATSASYDWSVGMIGLPGSPGHLTYLIGHRR